MGAFLSHCFLRCVIFICSFLIWIFIKKSLIGKRFYFLETFWFSWNLEVLKLTFKILRFWNVWRFWLEIWNLKSEILRFRILKIKTWNFDHEVWGLNFFFLFFFFFFEKLKKNLGIENVELKIFGMKILNWKFGVWKILENFEKEFFYFLLSWLNFWLSFKCGGWNFGPLLSCF